MASGIQYHVHFANGETHVADSLFAAESEALKKASFDQAPKGLLPAEICEVGPNGVGAGRCVKTIDET